MSDISYEASKMALDDGKGKLFATKNRNKRTDYYFCGVKVERKQYWYLKLKNHIKANKDIFFHFRVNKDYQVKMLILMKIWSVDTPMKLFHKLIDEYFSLIQLKRTKEILDDQLDEKKKIANKNNIKKKD